MTPQVHSAILNEIVRLIESRSRVPERVRVRGRQYQLTYLEDHKHRLEESIRRRDSERRNMLYGQLASKVKYQLIRKSRQTSARTAPAATATRKAAPARTAKKKKTVAKKTAVKAKSRRTSGKKAPAKSTSRARAAAKTRKTPTQKKKSAATPKKKAAKKSTRGTRLTAANGAGPLTAGRFGV